jgi:signal transduction histidine kinase
MVGILVVARERSTHAYVDADAGFLADVADRVALAIDNAQLYQRAQAAVRAREEFLSITSHELKTPLTAMKAATQLLERRLRAPAIDREASSTYTGMLLQQIDRLETLLRDLLEASRIQQGRLNLIPEPTELVQLAADVVSRFGLAPEAGVEHHLVVDAAEPVQGIWDPVRIDQVLTNLVSNAIKYSPQGGEIRLAVTREGAQAVVSIRDQGIGIPDAERTQLFQPFARGDSGRRHAGGSGLGLYITQTIVQLHGGTIAVESAPGVGTTFTLRLPLGLPAADEITGRASDWIVAAPEVATVDAAAGGITMAASRVRVHHL